MTMSFLLHPFKEENMVNKNRIAFIWKASEEKKKTTQGKMQANTEQERNNDSNMRD